MNTRTQNTTNRMLVTLAVLVLTANTAMAAGPFAGQDVRRQNIQRVLQPFTAAAGHDHADHDGGQCVELATMSVMFDADATAEDMLAAFEQVPDQEFDAFQPQGSTWTYTATDGSLTQGQPFTITYSFVPDGTEVSTSYGTADSNLYFQMNSSFPGNMTAFKQKVADALNRWSEFTNITYVEVYDDGAAWGSFGAPGLRGDVRIAMIPLGSPLAVNYYPQYGGDMVLDSQDVATFANSLNDFRSLRNTLMHEHGHGMGLKHNMPTDNTKLMEPYLNTNFDGPQEDDIRGAQFLYGDGSEYNDEFTNNAFIDGTLHPVAESGVITHVVDDVALERDGSVDWYGFGADLGTPIAIRLEPVGTTYTQAPQDNPTNTSTVNAKAARDLGLKLYTRTSVSNETIQLLATIDFNEAGEAEYHPPIPYANFGYGYMLVQIYSDDGINDVQRYRLTISNSAIEAGSDDQPDTGPEGAAEISVFNVTAGQEIVDGTTVQFGAVNVGQSAQRALSVLNVGDADLNVGQITLAGPGAADYGFTLIQSTIAPNGTGNLALSFAPQAAGVRQAVMTIPSNDPVQPNFSFILSGLGVAATAPEMEVTVDDTVVAHDGTFDFGDVELGDSATASVTIRNTGTATLSVTSVNFGGFAAAEYSATLSNATLSPGSAATMTVTGQPLVEGNRDAELRLVNNSQQGLFVVRFTANGVAEPITDCNANGVDDAEDIANGDSTDCNTNGTPDECETDSDGDTVPDECDYCDGEDDTIDTDGDGTPDCNDLDPTDPDVKGKKNNGRGLCGYGSGMPMMAGMLGLCGMGARRRRRR